MPPRPKANTITSTCQSSYLIQSPPIPVSMGERAAHTMSRLHGSSPKLDLKLYLSPTRHNLLSEGSPTRSASVSPPSSCVSSEMGLEDDLRYCSGPEATTSMLLVGCPNCLMYVMLSEGVSKCPRCKGTVLLDFLHDPTTTMKTRRT